MVKRNGTDGRRNCRSGACVVPIQSRSLVLQTTKPVRNVSAKNSFRFRNRVPSLSCRTNVLSTQGDLPCGRKTSSSSPGCWRFS